MIFKKIKKNETLINYYKRTSNEKNKESVIKIINGICIGNFKNLTEEFENEIIEFVDYFSKTNFEWFQKNQDNIVFELYSEIIKKRIQKKKDSIHKEITEQERIEAENFAKQIYSFKKDMIIVVSSNKRTYTEQLTNLKDLITIFEQIMHSKNGSILFYFIDNNQKFVMGFYYLDGKFKEIPENIFNNLSKKEDVIYITFSETKNMLFGKDYNKFNTT